MQNIRSKIWWQAIRFHFTFPTFLAVISGTSLSLLENNQWHKTPFFLVILATLCHHIGLNLIDDYYDYCYGNDCHNSNIKNIYSGGSGVLTNKLITSDQILIASMICYCLTILIGLFLAFSYGYWVLFLGILGIFSSYYYTAPPLKLAYRGLGELLIWLNFGPVLVIGSYFIHSPNRSIGVILLSIIMGTLIFCLIIANEIPDHRIDLLANKKTLIVRFGKKFGLYILMVGIIIIFSIVLFSTITKILPMTANLTFLSLPIAYLGIKKINKNIETNQAQGNELIVGFCNVFGILLICGFNIILIKNNQIVPALTMLLTLILFYFPILIFKPNTKK